MTRLFEWHKNTISRNTVAVDRQAQANVDAKLVEWKPTADETVLEGVAQPYPDVIFRRRLRLRGALLEDRFECESAAEHVYGWAFHAQGSLTLSMAIQPRPERLGAANGYQHITELAEGSTDGDWTARWEQQGSACTIRVKGKPGTQLFSGKGPGPIPGEDVALVMIRRRGAKAVFEVTHTFEKV